MGPGALDDRAECGALPSVAVPAEPSTAVAVAQVRHVSTVPLAFARANALRRDDGSRVCAARRVATEAWDPGPQLGDVVHNVDGDVSERVRRFVNCAGQGGHCDRVTSRSRSSWRIWLSTTSCVKRCMVTALPLRSNSISEAAASAPTAASTSMGLGVNWCSSSRRTPVADSTARNSRMPWTKPVGSSFSTSAIDQVVASSRLWGYPSPGTWVSNDRSGPVWSPVR